MPTPRELTGREALRALLPPQLEYVRPGGGTLRTADEVIDQYEREWAVLSSSRVEVREQRSGRSNPRQEPVAD